MHATALNDRSTPLALLATRRSAKARDLVAPGPTAAQLETILGVACRVPDHGKLAPWRFVVIDDRAAFADLLERLYRADRPAAGRLEIEAMATFAHQAPCCVALLSRPVDSHIPAWEQQLSAGAAGYALLAAAHALGFQGSWLTGAAAYLPGIGEALGVAGGRVAGFFFLGTAAQPPQERARPLLADVVQRFPQPAP